MGKRRFAQRFACSATGFGAWQLFAWRGRMQQLAGGLATSRPLQCGPICVILRVFQATFARAAQPNAGGGSAAGASTNSGLRLDWPRLCRTPTFGAGTSGLCNVKARPPTPLKSKAKVWKLEGST